MPAAKSSLTTMFALLPRTALGSTAMIQFPVLPLRTNRSYPAERPRPRRRQWSRSEFRGRTRPTARSPAAGQHCPPHPLHGPFPPLEAHRLHVLDRPRSTHDQTPYTTARAGGRGPRRSLAVPASTPTALPVRRMRKRWCVTTVASKVRPSRTPQSTLAAIASISTSHSGSSSCCTTTVRQER